MIVVFLPIIFLLVNVFRTISLFNNSDLILVYYSRGNGGFGDGDKFGYAIGENYCEQFDLGISVSGYDLKKYLPEKVEEITTDENLKEFEISFNTSWNDNSIIVYKDGKEFCKTKNKSHYSNIEFERGFYINND